MRRLSFALLSLLPLMATGCGSLDMQTANAKAPKGTGFLVRTVKVDGEARKYGVFVPHNYQPGTPVPAIVFLHGVLQAGSDGVTQMGQGLGPNIAKRPADFPALAIFPQSRGDWTGEARDRLAMAVLADARANYSIDADHIVLTGLSNGGYGTWHIGGLHPDVFSAIVPVSGQADYDAVPRLAHMPIWCFHNSGDFLIGVGNSREMVKRLQAEGAKVKYTEFDQIGHECWDQVYGSSEVINWMLAQRRSGAVAAAGR